MRKRVLRILPGYVVAVLLSTLAVGLFGRVSTHFFERFTWGYPISFLRLGVPETPPVFRDSVNGSLWTIGYEFRCYLLVAVCGALGLMRRRAVWAGAAVVLLAAASTYRVGHLLAWDHFVPVLGVPAYVFRLTGVFLVGACFYLYRGSIPFRPGLGMAAVGLLGGLVFVPRLAELAVIGFGGYLLFYVGQLAAERMEWFGDFPDISYGIYLYGWPVEILWITRVGGSPWVTFAASTVLCFGLGWLSWHYVERPMLRWKRSSTAQLPPP